MLDYNKMYNKRVKFAPVGRWDRQKAAAPYPFGSQLFT